MQRVKNENRKLTIRAQKQQIVQLIEKMNVDTAERNASVQLGNENIAKLAEIIDQRSARLLQSEAKLEKLTASFDAFLMFATLVGVVAGTATF
jgi:hypothetical protein